MARLSGNDPALAQASVPAGKLASFLAYVEERGLDPEPFRAAAGSADLPLALWMELNQKAAATLADPDFGLGYGHGFRGMPTLLGFLLAACPDLGAALDCYLRYQSLEHRAWRLEAIAAHDRLELVFRPASAMAAQRLVADFVMASLVGLQERLSGQALRPLGVSFAYPRPVSAARHAALFGCVPRFGAERTALVLPGEVLKRPLLQASPGVVSHLLPPLERALGQEPGGSLLGQRISQILETEALGLSVSALAMAARVGLSLRAMQAALRAEGTSFQSLRDRHLLEKAKQYLAEPGLSNQEIAWRLGFSEASAFHRACKRWTGRTPNGLRGTLG